MKTPVVAYSEKTTTTAYNWRSALQLALGEEPSAEAHGVMNRLATSWVTCAVGTQCAKIPRFAGGYPIDRELRRLGWNFQVGVRDRMWSMAMETLEDIEKRSGELLAEMAASA